MRKPRTKKQTIPASAARVIKFITEHCTHTKGQWAGKPFKLIPWQRDLIINLFGELKDNGMRQYRTCYTELPKKQGKTELAAAIALHMLCNDGERGGEVYSAAADRQQAGLVFQIASQMVVQDRTLSERLTIIESRNRIVDHASASFYQVLSSESYTKHGINPSCIIFDELHAQPNDELWNVLTSGTHYARRQQLIFAMSTAGVFDTNSIWWKIRDHSMKVRDGIIDDPSFLPILFIADKDDNPEDEEVWKRTNPSMGHIFSIDVVREDFKLAKERPSEYNNFLRFRLNIPVSTLETWIKPEAWERGNYPISEQELVCKTCYGGLDLSSTTDVTAFVLLFPPEFDGDKFKALPRFFIPEDNMAQRIRRDRVPYDIWVRDGFITATPGNVVDYNFILHQISEDAQKFDLREIAFDRWGATKVVTDLQNMGFEKPADNKYASRILFDFGQGFASMSAPTKELEKLIYSGELAHGNNPVLRWMINSVVITSDSAGNIKCDKGKSRDRIDGVIGLVMALDRALKNASEESEPSIIFI